MHFRCSALLLPLLTALAAAQGIQPVEVGTFTQHVSDQSPGLQMPQRDDSALEAIRNDPELHALAGAPASIRSVDLGPNDTAAAAAESGLYFRNHYGWSRVFPAQGDRSWAVKDVRAVDIDGNGRLWFASPQGVGVMDDEWTLYDGSGGLPYNDFTCMAALDDGTAWFGTTKGAIYFDGDDFRYRQGKRWLPGDRVSNIVVDHYEGRTYFATDGGVGVIESVPMTLAQKAAFYEDEIDKYHRRTPYEFVLQVSVPEPGVKEDIRKHDSDNDGLWTSMYGAGECFAYAATGKKKYKERAKKAFEAMRFLGTVTQGGDPSPPKGYVARTVLPTSGPDPNIGRIERDREEQKSDALWKAYEPRWPKSADGKWYWKSDTSSDELDGHYFLYGLYYDLVAETEEEKARTREHIQALTDHLITHGFNLVDVDGTPTRWARFSPEELNFDRDWFVERGLNSLSMLSYLYTTAHITGDDRYNEIAQKLIDEHAYAQNLMYPKFQRGVGTGNQSDDEMAFMGYYNLMKYAENEDLKERAAQSWWQYWRLEQPELNPLFNFMFASQCQGATFTDAWGTHDVSLRGDWLEESIDTLKRFPLDRFDWAHENSHRVDLQPLPMWSGGFDDQERHQGRGMRVNGRVLPVDERHFSHWNTDPFRLDYGGEGRSLADGAVFLLPYYMGLYHGFIAK